MAEAASERKRAEDPRAVKQLRLILSECLGALKEAGLVYEDEGCYYLK